MHHMSDCKSITISISMETLDSTLTLIWPHKRSVPNHELLAQRCHLRLRILPQTLCSGHCRRLRLQRYDSAGQSTLTHDHLSGCFLPYQPLIFWLEICLFVVLLLLHLSCLFLSRIEQRLLSAGLLLPSIAAAAYFIIWQQYVLRIEVITNSILMLLQGLHVVSTLV